MILEVLLSLLCLFAYDLLVIVDEEVLRAHVFTHLDFLLDVLLPQLQFSFVPLFLQYALIRVLRHLE